MKDCTIKIYLSVPYRLMMALCADAGWITLNNSESQPLPKGELLCICTNSAAGTFTYITKSKKRAAIKTFDI